MEEAEILLASSPTDASISCWNLGSGEEVSPPYPAAFLPRPNYEILSGLLLEPIFYWSRNKPWVKVSSSVAEPIWPLVSHSEGTHIVGGGLSGHIYFWEFFSGF